MSGKIRVLIAEEPSSVSGAVDKLVASQRDMEVVGQIPEGERVLAGVREHAPDVLVLELAMAGAGLRTLEQIAETCPGTRVVVLAMHEEISLLRSVLALGSLGYVVQRNARAELLSVIRKVSRGGRGYVEVPTGGLPIDPGLDPQSEKRLKLDEQLELLSRREREVLRAVAYGFTNREIAERLEISVKSVETYRYRVSEKLSFKSRADLVRFALEAGLLEVGGEGLPVTSSLS